MFYKQFSHNHLTRHASCDKIYVLRSPLRASSDGARRMVCSLRASFRARQGRLWAGGKDSRCFMDCICRERRLCLWEKSLEQTRDIADSAYRSRQRPLSRTSRVSKAPNDGRTHGETWVPVTHQPNSRDVLEGETVPHSSLYLVYPAGGCSILAAHRPHQGALTSPAAQSRCRPRKAESLSNWAPARAGF